MSDFKALVPGSNVELSSATTDMITRRSAQLIASVGSAYFVAGNAAVIRKLSGTGKITLDAEL
ncbi:hypothetical protein D3C80_2183340 [compost metagenome]